VDAPVDASGIRTLGRRHGFNGERLADAGIEPSVGSIGDSDDNALAETVIGLFKAEVIHRREAWKNPSAVAYATLGWVDWFNHRRLLEPIGFIPPVEAEATYFRELKALPMAAQDATQPASGKPRAVQPRRCSAA